MLGRSDGERGRPSDRGRRTGGSCRFRLRHAGEPLGVDVEDQVGDLPSAASVSAEGEVGLFPAFDPRSVHLDRDDGSVLAAFQQDRADRVPFDAAPGLLVVLGEERHDQIALLAINAAQFEIAVRPGEVCFGPLVIKDAVATEHFSQTIDDVPHEPAVLVRKGDGNGEWSRHLRFSRHRVRFPRW
jgi:hypothetical protein